MRVLLDECLPRHLKRDLGDRRRQFIAKHEAVLLYEAAKDLAHLLGREFRESAKALGTPDELMNRLNGASSDLSRFWQEHQPFLGPIRNAIAAHREHDALRYLETLEGVKPLEGMRRAAELSGRLDHLVAVITEIGMLTTSPAAIVQDMLKSAARRSAG